MIQMSFVKDLAERTGSTFVQAYLAVVLAVGVGGHVPWLNAFFVALFAAVAAALTTLLVVYGALRPFHDPYVDLLYRVAVTFGQTVLGLLVAAGTISALNFDWSAAAQTGLIAAGTALLKGLIGLRSPDTVGAAIFDTKPQPASYVEVPPHDVTGDLDGHGRPIPPGGVQPGAEPDHIAALEAAE